MITPRSQIPTFTAPPALRSLLYQSWLPPLHHLPDIKATWGVSSWSSPAPHNHLHQNPSHCVSSLVIYLPHPLDCKVHEVKDHVWCLRPSILSTKHRAWCPLTAQWCRDGRFLKLGHFAIYTLYTAFTKHALLRIEGKWDVFHYSQIGSPMCKSRHVNPRNCAQHWGHWDNWETVPLAGPWAYVGDTCRRLE